MLFVYVFTYAYMSSVRKYVYALHLYKIQKSIGT